MTSPRSSPAFVRYLWAAPATSVGVALSLAALAIGARAHIAQGCIEVGGGRLARCIARLPHRLRFAAITFGHVIIGVDHATLAAVRGHEQIHVRQYERFGVLFFPLYVGSSLLSLARGGDPYHDNHFEREACARAKDA